MKKDLLRIALGWTFALALTLVFESHSFADDSDPNIVHPNDPNIPLIDQAFRKRDWKNLPLHDKYIPVYLKYILAPSRFTLVQSNFTTFIQKRPFDQISFFLLTGGNPSSRNKKEDCGKQLIRLNGVDICPQLPVDGVSLEEANVVVDIINTFKSSQYRNIEYHIPIITNYRLSKPKIEFYPKYKELTNTYARGKAEPKSTIIYEKNQCCREQRITEKKPKTTFRIKGFYKNKE